MRQLLRASIVLLVIDATANGQSLADVAKQEEARRRSVSGSGRVYTNQDLPEASNRTPTPAPPDAGKPQAESSQKDPAKADATADAKAAAEAGDTANKQVPNPKRDEKYWRERTRTYRNTLTKLRADVAALEGRLETLRAVTQTPVVASEIRTVEKDLARYRTDLQSAEGDWTRIEKHARDAGASAWIEE